jgi:hypothetical protein
MNIDKWVRQPSTLHALGVIAAGLGAALTQVATGNHTADLAVGIAAYVLTHLGIDDNSALETGVTTVVTDLRTGASPTQTLTDAAALAGAAQTALTPPAQSGQLTAPTA